jgi:three-Cys-motif partner protein
MTSYVQNGTVGPWAAEKLACLEKYLSAYTTILRKQSHWCRGYFYIDAFAGAGRARLRNVAGDSSSEDQLILQVSDYQREDADGAKYIDGSPRVALGIEHPFTRYYFIESDPDRVSELERLKDEFVPSRDISIHPGDANEELQAIAFDSGIDWKSHRAVVLLDPFGLQVPWATIEKISRTNALEVIINLPVGMAIQRLLPRSGRISESQRLMLSSYFGSEEWEEVIYRESTDLFGEARIEKIEKSGEKLAKWYGKRLKAAFGYVSRPRLIRNSRRSHLYYLLFAGPKRVGARIADHVLSQGEVVN